jgi:DNA-binding NtrC family response regulator
LKNYKGIILTKDSELSDIFEETGQSLKLNFESNTEISDYLLKILDDVFSVIVFNCANLEWESLKWIKIIRRIRPKLPLIVISKGFDPQIGGELYDEGTFYYQQQPVNGNILNDVLNGALKN